MIMDNVYCFFIAQLLPEAIGSKNKKRIILAKRMRNNSWFGRQDRLVHRPGKSETWMERFPVVLSMFHICITNRSRNLNHIQEKATSSLYNNIMIKSIDCHPNQQKVTKSSICPTGISMNRCCCKHDLEFIQWSRDPAYSLLLD